MTITIQPAMRANMMLPYPWFIEEDGSVGRQDFWKGQPIRLAGFQASVDVNHVDLLTEDFVKDPQRAVGMYPVFIDYDGSMWAQRDKIESVDAGQAAKEETK